MPGSKASRNRRTRLKRETHLNISNGSSAHCTYKGLIRKQRQREHERRNPYIHPWIRDPGFRLGATRYPPASLPGLPPELRQHILSLCYPQEEISAHSAPAARSKLLCQRIGELCVVSPWLRVDMGYVGAQWKKRVLVDKSRSGVFVLGVWREFLFPDMKAAMKAKEGKVVVGKHQGAGLARERRQKCWYCWERHAVGAPC